MRTKLPRGLPQSVRCPICYQPAGYSCITWGGRRAHYSHEARKREAAKP